MQIFRYLLKDLFLGLLITMLIEKIFLFLNLREHWLTILSLLLFPGDLLSFAPSQQAQVEFFPFSVAKIDKNEELFEQIVNREVLFEQIVNREDNVKTFRFDLENFQLKPFFDLKTINEKQNYILFYGSSQPPYEKTGNEEEDSAHNIPHLYIGEQRSIIRKINFNRDDNPRSRAANYQLANPENQQDRSLLERSL